MTYDIRTVFLFQGLPGSGKTTLADIFHKMVGGARINADQVRASISTDLKFTDEDRLVQAHRMGALSGLALRPYATTKSLSPEITARLNQHAVVDFICPSDDMLHEFISSARFFGVPPLNVYTVWMNTIQPEDSRFPDTAAIYKRPKHPNQIVDGFKTHEQLVNIAANIAATHKLKVRD